MTDIARRWQFQFQIGEHDSSPTVVYGQSLLDLKEQISNKIKVLNSTYFRDLKDRYSVFFYSDGSYKAPSIKFERSPSPHATEEFRILEEGWYERASKLSFSKCRDINDAIATFLSSSSFIPEKGPDYQDIAIVDGILQLHLIRTVRTESRDDIVNALLKRGWYILAKNVEAESFTLGHTEQDAI